MQCDINQKVMAWNGKDPDEEGIHLVDTSGRWGKKEDEQEKQN